MRRIARSRRSDDGERVKFFPRAPLSERLEQAMRTMGPYFVVTLSKEIDFVLDCLLLRRFVFHAEARAKRE